MMMSAAMKVVKMTELNFKCMGCKRYFDCDVGQISFPPKQERPRFEKNIICPRCGIRSMDEVELSEHGQTQLGAVYFSSL